jgi:hypothetical protein
MLYFGDSRVSTGGLFSYFFIYSSNVGYFIGISLPLLSFCFFGGKISSFCGEDWLLVLVFFMKIRLNLPYLIVLFIKGGARDSFCLILFK